MLKTIKILFGICLLFFGNAVDASRSDLDPLYAKSARTKDYTAMVGVFSKTGAKIASATFLGVYGSGEEKYAIGLTTAHSFVDAPSTPVDTLQLEDVTSVEVFCGPDPSDRFIKRCTRDSKHHGIKVNRLFIPKGYCMQNGQGINDICLFVTDPIPKKVTIKTLPLYGGVLTGYTHLSGMVIGTGVLYEPKATKNRKLDYIRRKAFTCVTYYDVNQDLRGAPCFRTFLKGTLSSSVIERTGFMNGFSKEDNRIDYAIPSTTKKIWIDAHKKQVSFGQGSSGSSLIVNSDGLKVVAVLSQTSLETIGTRTPYNDYPLVCTRYEPVSQHPWLKECVDEFMISGRVTTANFTAKCGGHHSPWGEFQ